MTVSFKKGSGKYANLESTESGKSSFTASPLKTYKTKIGESSTNPGGVGVGKPDKGYQPGS